MPTLAQIEMDPAQFVIFGKQGDAIVVYPKRVTREQAKYICSLATLLTEFFTVCVAAIGKQISDYVKAHPFSAFRDNRDPYIYPDNTEYTDLQNLQAQLQECETKLRRWKIVAGMYC